MEPRGVRDPPTCLTHLSECPLSSKGRLPRQCCPPVPGAYGSPETHAQATDNPGFSFIFLQGTECLHHRLLSIAARETNQQVLMERKGVSSQGGAGESRRNGLSARMKPEGLRGGLQTQKENPNRDP